MASYNGYTRTNYFRVTDAERLKRIIDNAHLGEDALFQRRTGNETYYGFGCYGSIEGLCPNWERSGGYDDPEDDNFENEAPSPELFMAELQKILQPDDAIIITEVGYEKLRYLAAYSHIITKTDTALIELNHSAIETAQRLLNNPGWATVMEY